LNRQEAEERAREEAIIRAINNKVHRHMGMSAAILGLIAMIVALIRIPAMFGVSVGETFGILGMWVPLLLVIVGLGVLFSLGTTRLMLSGEWLLRKLTGKKAGE
jgi:hypothetical protein